MAGRPRRRAGREQPVDPSGLPPDTAAAPDSDPEQTARAICLRLLEARPRSRRELADALARKGAPDDVAERVLDRFTEVGLVDDAEYARMITASRVRERGLARRAVAAELRRRGVGDVETGAALATIDPDEESDAAFRLAARRQRSIASLPADVQRRRLVGYLGRRGYPAGLAHRAATAAIGDAGGGFDGLDSGEDGTDD
ncbi:regulatory protein RecX [Jatrophihabitans sp. YIM 134969]